MKPVTFACHETFSQTPDEISRQILDVSKWTEFRGYGPLPGIKSATFEIQTPNVLGTRIRVVNRDGSTHVEEIVEWEPARRLRLLLTDFSIPVSRLATESVETWEFYRQDNKTKVVRSFELHAKSFIAKPILWLVSFLLKGAIARHLREMRQAETS